MNPQVSWMTAEATLQRIDQIREQLESGKDTVRLAVGLRKQLVTEQATFVLAQAELQIRARKKFLRADQMLFTKVGLEQATSEVIAKFKATLVPVDHDCFDVCCGVGGDSIGLGKIGKVTCVDRDMTTCVFARHNLQVNGVRDFEVTNSDFEELAIPDNAFVHIDPDRRTKGRTIRAENFSPTLDAIMERLLRTESKRAVCIKLAPATRLEDELKLPHRKHWIGHHRECKQQLLWLGDGVVENSDRVTIVDNEGSGKSFEVQQRLYRQIVAPQIDEFIYEPHSAVLGADLVDEFAQANGLARLSYGSVYLTGKKSECSPFAAEFRLVETCSMKAKVIKAALRSHDMGQVEWKSRGLEQKTVAKLSKIKTEGSRKGVVILTRLGEKYICFIAERVVR